MILIFDFASYLQAYSSSTPKMEIISALWLEEFAQP
jgi:hypothetical protein